jgi:Ca2+-binding RTX toxin-like protein
MSAGMVGGPGDDILRGGTGDDAMVGLQGTDEHHGGPGNDFIDAAANERFATDARDVVDCGDGFDTALVLPADIVADNCEDVFNVFPDPEDRPIIAAASERSDGAQQRRLMERFLEKRGH